MELEDEKKMNENEYVYFFFGYFQWLEQIINIDGKKNLVCRIGWATTQLYCKGEGFCVAIQSFYCRDLGFVG